ncbi:cell division regulator GpsB [Fructilactobacillus frigidiflavus]|uniref:cell division regulator GpsB n=1 Tax=Fructilactobacillus frigidiflavus TaxID=3242688 RepID=UPI003756F7BA
MENIKFTPKEILQKEFKQKMRGYDPTDVDSFLDDVIKDYENFQKDLSEKEQQINQLNSENRQLKAKIVELENQIVTTPKPVVSEPSSLNSRISRQQPVEEKQESNVSTMDILKRLSNLERKVFGENSNN